MKTLNEAGIELGATGQGEIIRDRILKHKAILNEAKTNRICAAAMDLDLYASQSGFGMGGYHYEDLDEDNFEAY